MNDPYYVKKNSTGLSIASTLTSSNAADNLSSASAVSFKMRLVGDSALKVDGSGTVISATSSEISVKYDWTGTDLDTTGDYDAEWWVTLGGKTVKFPGEGYDRVVVEGDLS